MKAEVRKMIRRTALPAALAMPLAMVVPGTPAAHADASLPTVHLEIGQVANLDGALVAVGDTIAHLPSGPTGCGVGVDPIGVNYGASMRGTSVTLDIDGACNVIVSSISNAAADVVDDAVGATTLSPGAGIPALPETTEDAILDPSLLTSVDTGYATGIVTCKHQGWSKATLLYNDLGWVTTTESRVQANWSTTGYNNCYGRSVTNMVVNTNSKYSYCYWNSWESSSNNGCYYAVRKEAPEETAAKVWGHNETNGEWYDLNARIYSDTGSAFLAQCYLTNGSLPRNTKLDCHARQDS
jgi:hypothetical protein